MSIITYIDIILFRRISNSYDIYIYIYTIYNKFYLNYVIEHVTSFNIICTITKIYFFNNIVNIMCQHEKTITLKKKSLYDKFKGNLP